MADNEKLDLILSELQKMKAEQQKMSAEQQEMRAELQEMRAEQQEMNADSQEMRMELHDIKADIKVIFQKLNRLEVGQAETTRELFRLDRKISDTYNLALDAWGQGVENRAWFESCTAKA